MDLFEKIVEFKQPDKNKKAKDGVQQKIFEEEEILLPKKALDYLDQKMSNLQDTVEKQNTKMDEQKEHNLELQNIVKSQTKQSTRLVNSLEALLPEIQKVRVNDETAAINFSRNPDEKDLANWDLKAPSEAKYPLSSSKIAEKLGISSASQVGKMMKELKIKGDYLFHHEFENGKSVLQRYSYAAIHEIFNRLNCPDKYEIDNNIAIFWRQRIKKLPTKKG